MFSKFARLSTGIILLGLVTQSATASEQTTINWVIFEQVPYFITKGKLKGKGVGDQNWNQIIQPLSRNGHIGETLTYVTFQ